MKCQLDFLPIDGVNKVLGTIKQKSVNTDLHFFVFPVEPNSLKLKPL